MKNKIHFFWLLSAVLLISPNTLQAQIVGQKTDTLIIDRVLSVVGGHPIFQSDVEGQYLQARAMGYTMQGDIKCQILEGMLVGKLLLDQAEIDSIMVEESNVEAQVKRRIQGILQTAQGNEELVVQMFNKSMLEIEKDLYQPIKEQLLTQTMQEKITANIRVTPSEVQKFYKNIPKEEIPLISETMEIRQIIIKPEIPDEEILRVKNRLNELREQIQQGQRMSTLAVLYSEDPGSQPKGGELGLLPRGALVPEFTAVAYNLKKGDVSRVVESEFGFHIIELIERKGDMLNARHILMRPKVPAESKMKVREQLDSLANRIRSGQMTFDEAALLYSEDEQSRINGGIMVNPNTASTRFEPGDLAPALLNAIKNLKVGEISVPFEDEDDNGNIVLKIVSLKTKTPAHKADLTMDYQFLFDLAQDNKRQEVVDKWIQEKMETIYIKIHPDYKNCDFTYDNWVK